MDSWRLATVLLLVTVLLTPVENADVTYNLQTGEVTADSVCTDGELCFKEDDCQSCSLTDFSPEAGFDGDPTTRWSSSVLTADASASFTVKFAKPRAVSSIEVLFGYSNPPRDWNVQYVPAGGSEFLPWFEVVDSGTCPECTSPPCLSTVQDQHTTLCVNPPDESIKIPPDEFADQTEALSASAVMLEFVSFGESTVPKFYSVAEVSFAVLCQDSTQFLSALNYAECPAPNGLYQSAVDLPTSTGQSPPQLLWLLKGNSPESVAMWYLNSVEFGASGPASSVGISGGSDVTKDVCDPLGNEYGWLFTLSGPRNASTSPPSGASTVSFKLGVPSSCADGLEQSRVELYWEQDDNRNILSVYDLRGCGNCVNGLILKLLQISDEMRHAISQVPPFSVLLVIDEAEVNTIRELLEKYQNESDDWLLSLVLSERIYGLAVDYPDHVSPLPESIQQIEASLNSSILMKLSTLNQLVVEISKFDLEDDVKEVEQKVVEVGESLAEIQRDYAPHNFLQETDDLLASLASLLGELNLNLQELTAAVMHGNASLTLIRSRDYNQATMMLEAVFVLLDQVQMRLEGYKTLSEEHRTESETVESELRTYQTLLESASNISRFVTKEAAVVDAINVNVSELIHELEMLLLEAAKLNASATLNVMEASAHLQSSQFLLSLARNTTKEIKNSIDKLHFHINSQMKQIVDDYSDRVDQFRPTGSSDACNSDSSHCMAGEFHAQQLAKDSTTIIMSSSTTITVAEEFLLQNHIPESDLERIKNITSEAINISNNALDALKSSDVLQIYSDANNSLVQAKEVEQKAKEQLTASAAALEEASYELTRSVFLLSNTSQVSDTLLDVKNTITMLQNTADYTAEAVQYSEKASSIISEMQNVEDTLDEIEDRIPGIEDNLASISIAISQTSDLLDDTNDLIGEANDLAATASDTAKKAVEGVTDLMDENDELIMDIDDLIASVSKTHDMIKKINSPAVFKDSEAFLILQPPPNQVHSVDGSILIDSININILIDQSVLPLPALIFYAGPVSDNPGDDLSSGDFIAVTISEDTAQANYRIVTLTWRLGPSSGVLTTSDLFTFYVEIYITRVGSQFELLVGSAANRLGEASAQRHLQSNVNSASLHFRVTPQTEYIFGGIPPNAFLALPEADKLKTFEVLYNLVLVNGELWSLWDYSKRSDTDFLSGTFNVHQPATENLWLTPVERANEYILSFDGAGYLKPASFVNEEIPPIDQLSLHIRPVSINGLILFLYDERKNETFEVALVNGRLKALYLGEHESSKELTPEEYADNDGVGIEVELGETTSDDISSTLVNRRLFASGFSPSTTHAWMGGVKESELKFPFVPRLTNESFRGCLSIKYDTSDLSLFDRSNVRKNYFTSDSTIKGVSGTCLLTEALLEVGFAGLPHPSLSYSHIEAFDKPNEKGADAIPTISGHSTIAMSFRPQLPNGVLLGTSQQTTDVVIGLKDSRLVVLFENDNDEMFTLDGDEVTLGEWHDLLLELSRPDSGGGEQRLFVDNFLVSTTNHDLKIPDPEDKYESNFFTMGEKLALGGVREDPLPDEQALGNFVGCIRNVAFDLDLMKILSSGTERIETDNIFYDLCPADMSSGSNEAVLSVFASPPEDTSCFQPPPAKLEDTLGGFHASTQLTTSNIFGLFSDEWRMNLDIRLVGSDGRVLTISSETGIILTLDVVAGPAQTLDLKFELSTTNSDGESSKLLQDYPTNTWIPTQISCNVVAGILSCNVNAGDKSDILTISHPQETFAPVLPMSFGVYSNENSDEQVPSFTGCIRNVGVNGNQTGFDDLSTCTTCYESMETGDGFTGISYISKSLAGGTQPSYTVSFSFRSERKEGLLLLLTTAANAQGESQILLGIGLFDGEVRATTFSATGESQPYTTLSTESLCDSTRTGFTMLSVDVTGQEFTIGLQYESEAKTEQTIASAGGQDLGDVVVYLGGLPSTFHVVEGTDPFSFLLSVGSEEDSLPPGMLGCMKNWMAEKTQGDTGEDSYDMVNVLEGLCATV